MPTFSSGKVSAFPVGLQTSLSLAQLRTAIAATKLSHDKLLGGWASTTDKESNLRQYDAIPPDSEPTLVPQDGTIPEHVMARYYYFVNDAGRAQSNPGRSPQFSHRLEAVDLLLTKTSPGSYVAVFSTRNLAELNIGAPKYNRSASKNLGALASLKNILRSSDERATITMTSSPLSLGSPDFFLWLMERKHVQSDLDGTLTLTGVTGLSGQDNIDRVTQMRQDIDFYRVGMLTSIAENDLLGPAKIAFKDATMGAALDIEIFEDGGFSLIMGRSHYASIVGKDAMRARAILDLVFHFVPKFRDLYAADVEWTATRRAVFVSDAFAVLAGRYNTTRAAGGTHCGDCGQLLIAS